MKWKKAIWKLRFDKKWLMKANNLGNIFKKVIIVSNFSNPMKTFYVFFKHHFCCWSYFQITSYFCTKHFKQVFVFVKINTQLFTPPPENKYHKISSTSFFLFLLCLLGFFRVFCVFICFFFNIIFAVAAIWKKRKTETRCHQTAKNGDIKKRERTIPTRKKWEIRKQCWGYLWPNLN